MNNWLSSTACFWLNKKKNFTEQMEHTFIPKDFNTFKQGLQFQ